MNKHNKKLRLTIQTVTNPCFNIQPINLTRIRDFVNYNKPI